MSHRHQLLRSQDDEEEGGTYILIAKSALCVRERRTSGYTLRSSEMRSRRCWSRVRDRKDGSATQQSGTRYASQGRVGSQLNVNDGSGACVCMYVCTSVGQRISRSIEYDTRARRKHSQNASAVDRETCA